MTNSQNIGVGTSGDLRSMNTPKSQTARPDTKYAKSRLSRLPGLRASVIPASRTFRASAKSGRRLWSVKRVPLGIGEREIGFVLPALLVDLLFEDPEHEDVPEPAVLVAGSPEDALPLVPLGLDAPEPKHIASIVGDELARLHAKSAADRLRVGQHHLEEAVPLQEV